MHGKVLVIKFKNAGIFPYSRWSADKMYDLYGIKDGKTPRSAAPVMQIPAGKFDYRHVSNILHVLMGERPVPTIRRTLLKPDTAIQEAAKKALVVIDTPISDKGKYVCEETINARKSVSDAYQTAKTVYHLSGQPVLIKGGLIYWRRLERILGSRLFKDLINTVQGITKDAVVTRSMAAQRAIEILHDHYDSPEVRTFCKKCLQAKLTTFINIINPRGNKNSITIHSDKRTKLNMQIIGSGPEKIVRLSGKIFIPLDTGLLDRLANGCGVATVLEGGMAYIAGIYDLSEYIDIIRDAEPVIEAPIERKKLYEDIVNQTSL
ncbi:MAG: hypothetical protein ABFD50_22215 [Smithella sp.]